MVFPDKEAYGYTTIMPSFALVSGSCRTMSRLSEGLLLVVNIIGGLVLGISSYLQQLCTSPTLKDILSEMGQRGDVNFGSNSPSALFRRFRSRKSVCLLWIILLITSLPAHLLLNGSIGLAPTFTYPSVAALDSNVTSQYVAGTKTTWTNVTSQNCRTFLWEIQYYASFNVSNLLVVVDTAELSNCSFLLPVTYNLTSPPSLNASESNELVQELLPCAPSFGSVPTPILYCLAAIVDEQCALAVRWLPSVIFSASLTLKAIVACLALYIVPHFRKRLYNSIGDFICFAVENPTSTIPNESLCSKRRRPGSYTPINAGGVKATYKHKFWAWYFGKSDWLIYIFWILGVATMWFLLGYYWNIDSPSSLQWEQPEFGLAGTDAAIQFQWLSSVGPSTISSSDIFQAVVLSNLPQLWISCAYLLFNNQITRLWLEREWRSFYRKSKKPRTANMSGYAGTRQTRWLQLPYSLSALMIAVSILLHWVASQSMYFVESYASSFQQESLILYLQPLPTIVMGSIWTLIVFAVTVVYFLPQRSPMPVMAGSARVVLASCCTLAELPPDGIMWGDITEQPSESTNRKAGFATTAGEIVEGAWYL